MFARTNEKPAWRETSQNLAEMRRSKSQRRQFPTIDSIQYVMKCRKTRRWLLRPSHFTSLQRYSRSKTILVHLISSVRSFISVSKFCYYTNIYCVLAESDNWYPPSVYGVFRDVDFRHRGTDSIEKACSFRVDFNLDFNLENRHSNTVEHPFNRELHENAAMAIPQ